MKKQTDIIAGLKMGLDEVAQFDLAFPEAVDPEDRREGDWIRKELEIAAGLQAPEELVVLAVERAANYLALRAKELGIAGCSLAAWKLEQAAAEAVQRLNERSEPIARPTLERAQI